MSLTALHKPSRRKLTDAEYQQYANHFHAMQFVEENFDALLLKVFRAHSFPTESFDGDRACRVVATFLEDGNSFHEALYELCFMLDNPGWLFHWRRNDLKDYRPKLCPEQKTKQRKRSTQSLSAGK